MFHCLITLSPRHIGQYLGYLLATLWRHEPYLSNIKQSPYMTKNSRQKLKYLENEKSF